MDLPFTSEQFLEVFAEYNRRFWVVALLWWVASLVLIFLIWRHHERRRIVWLFLGALWLWNASAYHALLFTRINPAAWLFAALFGLQAVAFFRMAACANDGRWISSGWQRNAALTLVVYALAYPSLTIAFGHRYPAAPTFGVPCPTAILSIGLLLAAPGVTPGHLVIVPMLWSIVGGSAAIFLRVPTDYVLFAAGGALVMRMCHTTEPDGGLNVPLGRRTGTCRTNDAHNRSR